MVFHGLAVERLGLSVAVCGVQQRCQIIEPCRGPGMIWAKGGFIDLQSPAIERLGLSVAVCGVQQRRQIVEVTCYAGMVGT